ncbi:MAG: hypothetical protein QOD31_430, partial [Pseudonocardiales bacterium]|nr:hypothetical protein [Pseudonocardiales bacterium]
MRRLVVVAAMVGGLLAGCTSS